MPYRLLDEDRYYRQPVLDPKEYKRVIYDPGIVTRIIFNRPRYLNAFSHALLAELEDAADRASADPECHVVVLSGAGPCFSSGDDNNGLTPESAPTLWDGDARPPEKLVQQYGSESAAWHQYNIEHDHLIHWLPTNKLRTIPKPTIAMVHGWCIFQGLNVASSMDMIFAAEDAMFLGARADARAIWNVGPRKALELAYEHRFLTAREAYDYHMVNRIFPTREVLERETMSFAYRIARQSPSALRRAKEEFLNTMDRFGFLAAVVDRTPHQMVWRQDAEEGHQMRYEGKGRARTPVALANLKAKLDSEGKEIPAHVKKAIDRVAARDDKATWHKVLHAEWRDPKRVARADNSAGAYEQAKAEFEGKKKAEIERRGLNIKV